MRMFVLIFALLIGGSIPIEAQETTRPEPAEPPTLVMAGDLTWQDGPMGGEVAVLQGNPATPGPFVMRLRLPENQVIEMHWHPGTEHVTVLEGNVSFALGLDATREDAQMLRPGGYLAVPAGTPIQGWVGSEGVLVQVHGEGVFETIPIAR